jgi:hypothetical protein
VLFLGSCGVLQFIFGSVFPSTLMLAKAQADLSGQIDPGLGNSFSVRVVETGGYGYVVVVGSQPTTGSIAIFYDLNLNLKGTITITGLPVGASAGVMADASGKINAGGTLINADLSSPVAGSPVVSYTGGVGNDGFVANTLNIISISSGGSNTLSYWHYASDWTGGAQVAPLPTLSSSLYNLQNDAVLDDGNSAGNVILVIRQSGGGDNVTRYFVTIPKTAFTTTVPSGLLDLAPHRDNLDRDTLGFANGSIFAYDRGSSSYIRIDPADGSIQSSLYSSVGPRETRFAYRASGDSFYGFDTKSRVLTKYAAWW